MANETLYKPSEMPSAIHELGEQLNSAKYGFEKIEEAIEYSKDGTQYESDLTMAKNTILEDNAYFEDIGEAIAEKDGGEIPEKSEMAERIENIKNVAKGIIWTEINADGYPVKVDAYVNELPYYSFSVTGNYNSNSYIFCKEITIHEGCTKTNNFSFYHNNKVEKIVLPKTLTVIGTQEFDGCSNLSDFIVLGKLSDIGPFAFRNCSSLSSLSFLNTVKNIGNNAFTNVSKITSVIIPPLFSLGTQAFSNNPQIKVYDFTSWIITDLQTCVFYENIFYNISPETIILFATQEIAEIAKATTNLSVYADRIKYVGEEY